MSASSNTREAPQPPTLLTHKDGYMEQVMICNICQEIPLQPVTPPCDHIFCRTCIDKALCHKSECPNDRRCLTPADLQPISGILRRIWEQIGVQCPACESWTGTLGTYQAHAARCIQQQEVLTTLEYQQKLISMRREMALMKTFYEGKMKELTKSHTKKIQDVGKKRSREIEDLKVRLMQKFEEISTTQQKLLEAELQETLPMVKAAAKAEVLAEHDPAY